MQIAFVTWVNPHNLRWHLRFFRYSFLQGLKVAKKVDGEVTMHIAAMGLPDHICDHIADQWIDSPIRVRIKQIDITTLHRHRLIFRPFNRVAALNPEDQPDYIISLHPSSVFSGDAIHDYLDTAVRMEHMPELGCVIHAKAGPPARYAARAGDRNSIYPANEWGLRQFENVVFRNLSNLHPDYNYMLHKSVSAEKPYYLEDVVCIYSGMLEGWGIGMRYYTQATVYDALHRPGQPDHMSNCFGRMRGDNWQSDLNAGWRKSPDRKFCEQLIYTEDWEQKWRYVQQLQFRPAFFAEFTKKHEALKIPVAPSK